LSEQNPNPVVVAIGHDQVDAALEYAAGEASRLGCGLHLVQFVQVVRDGPETVLVDVTDAEQVGRQSMHAALKHARCLIGDATLTSHLVLGGVVPALVASARDARLVVLQRRALSRSRRVVTRSVVSGVAAYTAVPVVSVPASWSVDRKPDSRPTVTVGVDAVECAEEVLRAAVDAARARFASLHVLHARDFRDAGDGIFGRTRLEGHRAPRETAEIQAALERLGHQVTGVPVQIDAPRLNPADALIQASRVSDLVVIGRHDALAPPGSHLGPVARAVLAEAACPVLLADPRKRHGRSAEYRGGVGQTA
jgi:nucleotide-binding universal stress UspA family protein